MASALVHRLVRRRLREQVAERIVRRGASVVVHREPARAPLGRGGEFTVAPWRAGRSALIRLMDAAEVRDPPNPMPALLRRTARRLARRLAGRGRGSHTRVMDVLEEWLNIGDWDAKGPLLRAVEHEFAVEGAWWHPRARRAADMASREDVRWRRDLVRAIYEETQELLRREGVEAVVVWRGLKGVGPPTRGDVALAPATSFSLDPAWAWEFAKDGVIVEAVIPRERILSLPMTGFGSLLGEYEVVVLGGRIEPRAVHLEREKRAAEQLQERHVRPPSVLRSRRSRRPVGDGLIWGARWEATSLARGLSPAGAIVLIDSKVAHLLPQWSPQERVLEAIAVQGHPGMEDGPRWLDRHPDPIPEIRRDIERWARGEMGSEEFWRSAGGFDWPWNVRRLLMALDHLAPGETGPLRERVKRLLGDWRSEKMPDELREEVEEWLRAEAPGGRR